mmetsp:Transcript_39848/g.84980  ORF Transcript_39848/g.84980 Transcript_39848/m.84980 type:complete len:240 (+) Transcript_39848:1233-1952(+)
MDPTQPRGARHPYPVREWWPRCAQSPRGSPRRDGETLPHVPLHSMPRGWRQQSLHGQGVSRSSVLRSLGWLGILYLFRESRPQSSARLRAAAAALYICDQRTWGFAGGSRGGAALPRASRVYAHSRAACVRAAHRHGGQGQCGCAAHRPRPEAHGGGRAHRSSAWLPSRCRHRRDRLAWLLSKAWIPLGWRGWFHAQVDSVLLPWMAACLHGASTHRASHVARSRGAYNQRRFERVLIA